MALTQVTGNGEAAGPGGDDRRAALLELLQLLAGRGYQFVTATPGTHTRVVARPDRQEARTLRDVLGWSLPFTPDVVPADVLALLRAAGAVSPRDGDRLGADLRVSSVQGTLFLHSAFPTLAQDSVFLGPDSYRFADLIVARMGALPAGARILDYAAGAGVGGISAARRHRDSLLTLADINPKASFLSSINAEFAGLAHEIVSATTPGDVAGTFDLIVTHPPFMMDSEGRAYRDGGDLYGARLSLDWVMAGIAKLTPGGRLILHTGVSIVDGRDVLLEQIDAQVRGPEWDIDYHELDPDIFSEDLDQPAYAEVERIAAVGLCITRRRG
jgi:hypothetical protein